LKRGGQDTAGLVVVAAGLVALLLLLPLFSAGLEAVPLRILFGWGAYIIVPALLGGGAAIVFASRARWRVRWVPLALAELLLLVLLALTHATRPDPLNDAFAGHGGGLAGWAFGQILVELAGLTFARVALVLIALLVVAALVLTLPPGWLTFLKQAPIQFMSRVRARFFPGEPAGFDTPGLDPVVPARRPPAAIELGAVTPPARKISPAKRARKPAVRPDWLPSLDLLRLDKGNGAVPGAYSADARQRAQLIKQTLAEFGIPVEVVSIKEGPTVTQFGLEPGEFVRENREGVVVRRRVPVNAILRLQNDLALALSAGVIRIEAPVPGRPYVGIEVPNTAKTMVSLRNILESREFAEISSPLAIALGRDVSGDPIVSDLTSMPHLLIAGATGSGKSVCINAIVCSLLMSNGPETVRLVLIDPKMVELPGYNGIPHLAGPVITDPAQAAGALSWLMVQMDERYRLFAESGVRNITEYNRKTARARHAEPLPYLVLVVDELADLMMTAAVDIERQICRLAQMARATGIHLVLATQRPSVDVITGLIKANFPARIAFAVTTQIDSRVILDSPGAEKLLGRGDMLLMTADSAKLARVQGCFVSDTEINRVVAFWRARAAEEGNEAVSIAPWQALLDQGEARDEMMEQALKLLETRTHVSTSLLQRQLRLGYPRAARLMEQLEEMGAVGPDEGGGRTREVLWRPEDPEQALH
jgi:DNA segregation ATPase FtsK/SpoIIIE, S-DNA-T family